MDKKEAIKRIKERLDKKTWYIDEKDMEALSELIPELAESEDERIRQMIGNTLRDAVLSERISETSYREMSAYLEKQKDITSVASIQEAGGGDFVMSN